MTRVVLQSGELWMLTNKQMIFEVNLPYGQAEFKVDPDLRSLPLINSSNPAITIFILHSTVNCTEKRAIMKKKKIPRMAHIKKRFFQC